MDAPSLAAAKLTSAEINELKERRQLIETIYKENQLPQFATRVETPLLFNSLDKITTKPTQAEPAPPRHL